MSARAALAGVAALVSIAATAATASALRFIPVTDPAVRWVGRRIPMQAQRPANSTSMPIPGADGLTYAVEWEGTAAEIGIIKASVVAAVIYDNSGGHSRFAGYLNTQEREGRAKNRPATAGGPLADPDPYGTDIPSLRTNLFSTHGLQTVYVLAAGDDVSQSGIGARVTIQLLTEPSFIDGGSGLPAGTPYPGPLQIAGFLTDGEALPPRPLSKLRFEILGDSLTAGYGAGFDAPAAPPGVVVSGGILPCAGGVPVDDISTSYGGRLCTAFGADCTWVAVSGVTIMAGRPTLPTYWDLTLGSMATGASTRWPQGVTQWNQCNATLGGGGVEAVPDAVLINLGENDMHAAPTPIPPSWYTQLAQSYLTFIDHLWGSYGACYPPSQPLPKSSPAFFLIIGPHEAGQSVAIAQAMPLIQAAGYDVTFINATVPLPPVLPAGCGGHPGPSLHLASAQRAAPVIAAATGWNYTGL